jgi:hypothetical protein
MGIIQDELAEKCKTLDRVTGFKFSAVMAMKRCDEDAKKVAVATGNAA